MAGKRLTGVARKLRTDMTDAERRLWNNNALQNTDGVLLVILEELKIARNR